MSVGVKPNNLKIWLLFLGILIALVAYTPNYIKWKQQEAETNRELSESPFFISHVLNPRTEGYNFLTWNRQNWLNWLQAREEMHARANTHPNRRPLTGKVINTVLISTPSEFMNAFEGRKYSYQSHNGMYWGNMLFPSYVFHRSGSGNSVWVYRCPPMYVAVKLEDGKPVHLELQSKRMVNDNIYRVKPSKDCVRVN